jgi:hypothetical protein
MMLMLSLLVFIVVAVVVVTGDGRSRWCCPVRNGVVYSSRRSSGG